MQLPAQLVETRQCLLKAIAAALLYAKGGTPPAHVKVLETAQILRTEHWWAAKEASCVLGESPPWVSPEESDLRVF
eukprot:4512977-Heterocapsa_arctica.AAC.1